MLGLKNLQQFLKALEPKSLPLMVSNEWYTIKDNRVAVVVDVDADVVVVMDSVVVVVVVNSEAVEDEAVETAVVVVDEVDSEASKVREPAMDQALPPDLSDLLPQ